MKKIILTNLFFVFVLVLNAQVTLNKTYNYSASVVKLETLGYKYYLMDVPNEQCRIYNMDHSLFKTINCNVPSNFYLADIKFISENVFDNDAGIELLCTFYRYYSNSQYYEYDSKIINDDGSTIVNIDGAQYNYINPTGENEYKLFSYCFDYSVFPEKVWTNIYNLPGAPIVAIAENKSAEIQLNAFPNPATQTLKVAYNLPPEANQGTLHLVNNYGQEINRYVVDGHINYLELDVSNFSSGLYHYFLEYGNTKTPSKKLVIQ